MNFISLQTKQVEISIDSLVFVLRQFNDEQDRRESLYGIIKTDEEQLMQLDSRKTFVYDPKLVNPVKSENKVFSYKLVRINMCTWAEENGDWSDGTLFKTYHPVSIDSWLHKNGQRISVSVRNIDIVSF